jgi:acyl transferase domain-containing protein/acyl carrier protein
MDRHDHGREEHPPVAIIGMSCRFPGGATDPARYWDLLSRGVDATGEVPAARWDARRFYDPDPDKPGKMYVRRGGFLRDPIDGLDLQFFGLAPREAVALDPQQRLLMEIAAEALEDAGLPLDRLQGSNTGVFVGGFTMDNKLQQLGVLNRGQISTYTAIGVSLAMLSNRLSYTFDLRGPSVTVDTACSSSLVALHLACRALWNGDCDLAVSGGVGLIFRPEYTIAFCKSRVLSPDGRCKTFDESADGYSRGEGSGAVVLKLLPAALADGDRIHAVVCATGVNQDGRTSGITNPNGESQKSLLLEVCRRAGVSPGRIGYVEAHGTGTQAGDQAEARSLGEVLALGRPAGGRCWIGSVKTNIGHLEAAAGIAGLIKTALCLKNRAIPPHLHLRNPNPKIDFDGLRLRIPTALEPWPEGDSPRYAAVNSFGYGGTNASAILREAPVVPTDRPAAPSRPALIPLSAHSEKALDALIERLGRERLEGSLADIAHTLAVRRTHRDCRVTVVASTRAELQQELAAHTRGEARLSIAPIAKVRSEPKLAFAYTGMGPQWWGMGRELMAAEPVFQEAVEECDRTFRELAGWSLADLLSEPSRWGRAEGDPMPEPQHAQPANFVLQMGLTALWRSFGLTPDLVVGHSVGEIAAAAAAGSLSLDDALRLTWHRSRLQQTVAGQGAMLAVECSPEEVEPVLAEAGGRVSLAAVNSHASVTLSGETSAVEAVAASLTARGISHRRLTVEVAYHSAWMDPLREPFLEALQDLRAGDPGLLLLSTVTGRAVTAGEQDAAYWWRNTREPVRLAEALERLIDEGCDTVLEVGPHPVLAGSIRQALGRRGLDGLTLSSLRRGFPERATMLASLGSLFTRGRSLDWRKLHPSGQPVTLPAYPWQRDTEWTETGESRADRFGGGEHPLLQTRLELPLPAWEGELGVALLPDLADHRVDGLAVFPGAAYVEACLAAAAAGDEPTVVEDLVFHKALLPEVSSRLRLSLDGEGEVSIHSRAASGAPGWTLHASGRVERSRLGRRLERLDLRAVRERCPREIPRSELYESFAGLGLQYGPAFRTLRRVWKGEDEVLALVELAEAAEDGPGYRLHPALLDGCFQSLLATLGEDAVPSPFVPVRVREVRFHARPGARAWCHGRRTKGSADAFEGDLVLCDDAGNTLVEIAGLRCKALRQPAASQDGDLDRWLYRYRWEAREAPAGEAPEPGTWVLFQDRGGLADVLAERLEDRAQRCIRVSPDSPEDLDALFASLAGEPWTSIVYVCGFAAGPQDGPLSGLSDVVPILRLVQAAAAAEAAGFGRGRLFLVTDRSQEVLPGEAIAHPGQGAVWGLGRVVANEHPLLGCTLVDVDGADPGRAADGLVAELLGGEPDEPEIALRAEARHVHRLVHCPLEESAAAVPSAGRPYQLVTTRPGILEGLAFEAAERRRPGRGEIEVEVHTASLSFKDLLKVLGLLPETYLEGTYFQRALGFDCSGFIAEVGEGVEGFAAGDPVLFLSSAGCMRSFVTARADFVLRLPAGMSLESLIVILNFIVPYYGLHEAARLQPGEHVLIHSAASGVGAAAVQVARWLGARIIATAGTPARRDHVRSLGVDLVSDSHSPKFVDDVLEWTDGRGVDVVLNSLSGDLLTRSFDLLAPFGRFVEIGKRDITQNRRLSTGLFDRNRLFLGLDLDQMMVDRPDRFLRLARETLDHLAAGDFPSIPVTTFPPSGLTEALRLMERGEHTGKLGIRFYREPADLRRQGPAIGPDATYLITGGFGGFGLEVARWLVAKGARHLVLAGRRGAVGEAATAAVLELRQAGAEVVEAKVDIGDEAQVRALVRGFPETLPPLRGIVHAAMVLDDAVLLQLDAERVARVMTPKAMGAWHLHRETLGRPLDFFLLFSSVSSLIGNPGQGSYAAANAFLDSLAQYRRALSLPATSINWGVLSEVGVVARNPEVERRLARLGIHGFTPAQALAALERILEKDPAQIGVLDVDWARMLDSQGLGARAACYSDLVAVEKAGGAESTGRAILDQISGRDPEEQRQHLQAFLGQQVQRILQLPPDRIEFEAGLNLLGVDSLTAVELGNVIRTETKVDLPFMKIQDLTILDLASELQQKIHGSREHPGAAWAGAAQERRAGL